MNLTNRHLARTIPAVVALGVAALLSCGVEGDPPRIHDRVAYRITPRTLDASGDPGDARAAWALFDRDTATRFTPHTHGTAPTDLTLTLDPDTEIDALKVFGTSAYTLSLLDARGQLLSGPHNLSDLSDLSDLSELGELGGWTIFPLAEPQRATTVTLQLTPIGQPGGPISDVELWGTSAPVAQAWSPPATRTEKIPAALADVIAAEPAQHVLSAAQHAGTAACASFALDLARHPGVYRRAWLRYQAAGVFRPLVLRRAINDGPMTAGRWVPPAPRYPGAFVHPIDPELLHPGLNELHFCLPDDAGGTVKLSGVELVTELDHGSNIVDAVWVAPYDGLPATRANRLLDRGGEVQLDTDQELVVSFDRWTAPDALQVTADPAGTDRDIEWSLRCVAAQGAAKKLDAVLLDQTDDTAIYAMADPGRERCAGLRLQPSGEVRVTELRVVGSGTDRRIDFPRLVIASEREHFGDAAWIDGWIRLPGDVGGSVDLRIDGKPVDAPAGAFATMLSRAADTRTDWPVTVTARLADGTRFSQTLVLTGALTGAGSATTKSSAGSLHALSPGAVLGGLSQAERRARFGAPGQRAAKDVPPGQARRVALGTDVAVDVPAGAVTKRTRVSITHLDTAALPPLDPGFINVTAPAGRGYEFLPHGQTFEDALEVTLPYQPSLVPRGYTAGDIHTFYYDESLGRWEPLARAQVAEDRQVVESLTDHFTIMINAIVVAPEHPQAASFDPNRLQGIEAANPAAGVQTLDAPQANSRGSATMSYPLAIPPGRLGVQPGFALAYNSAQGNGWLGVGWDLNVSTIDIDTRWGVPRYDPHTETETYLLDGEQLAPTAHRGAPRDRSADTTTVHGETVKVFRSRVQRASQQVVRHGQSPRHYWWEVTSPTGVRSFYGGTPDTGADASARLTDDTGNIYKWALRELRDPHGNRVRFDYHTVTWSAAGAVPGRDLYLAEARYTLRPGQSEAPYRVTFLREPRPDLIVNGRGGFKQVTSERLRRIEVHYRQTLVRAWDLSYDQGPFGKSRLRRWTQYGVGGAPFPGNVHELDYFDELTQGSSAYNGFAPVEAWSAGHEEPDTGLIIPQVLLDVVGEASTSALGGSRTRSAGLHLYSGFNPTRPTKQGSFGAKIGGQFSQTDGLVALADVDGDGLPDRVFRGDGGFFYNRNQSGPDGTLGFSARATPIAGFSTLSQERSFTLSVGPEAYPATFQFHQNTAFSFSMEDTYLSDVNADGLVDLVKGSEVYFNRLVNGVPTFVADDSAGTIIPLGASAVSTDAMPASFEDSEDFDIEEHTPPVDTVRRWQALYPGRVRISGGVRLAQAQRTGADGVRVSIEHEGQTLWSRTLSPADTGEQQPDVELDVAAGDRLYFRVHAIKDGRDDRVVWSPVIEYRDIAPARDENGLEVHRFDAAADFVLAGRSGAGMQAPFTGTLRLSGQLIKERATTDDVEVRLTVDDVPVLSQTIAASSQGTVDLAQDLQVSKDSFIALQVHSDSPIDLTAIGFAAVPGSDGTLRRGPWVQYVSAQDDSGEPLPVVDDSGEPFFDMPLLYDMTSFSRRSLAAPAPAFVPQRSETMQVTAKVSAGLTLAPSTVTFTAKSGGRLLAKDQITVQALGSSGAVTLDVPVTQGEPVFFAFSTTDPEAPFMYTSAHYTQNSTQHPLPTIRYGVAAPTRISRPYRGWSYGGYNGGGERGEQPIEPGALETVPDFPEEEPADQDQAREQGESFADTGNQAFAFTPRADAPPCTSGEDALMECSPAAGSHWLGPHDLVYVSATEMSTTRMGGPGASIPTPAEVAGGRAVPRLSVSLNLALGGGLGPLSVSAGAGGGHGLLDFMDMNGDRFPDVLGPGFVQYTSPRGVLSESRSVGGLGVRDSVSANLSVGVGGNVAKHRFGARGQASSAPGKAQSQSSETQQMPTLGFSVNAGGSGGHSESVIEIMDMNGDGLPDRVQRGLLMLRVALNLGYGFADYEPWGQAGIHAGNTVELNGGPSLSFGDGIYGVGGGVTASLSKTKVDGFSLPGPIDADLPDPLGMNRGMTLTDMNGDGLVDRVQPDDHGLRVWFNLGHGFASTPVLWQNTIDGADISESRSTSVSGGLYFTVPVGPLCLAGCYLILNPGGDVSESVGRPVASVQDVDGDGYPDHVVSETATELRVARNRTGRTNLLRHVKRPLGAELWLDYTRAGNTQDMPRSEWVLSEVKIYDGQADSAELGQVTDYTMQRMSYAGGREDPRERELYGFARVTVDTLDTRGWSGADPSGLPVYRRLIQRYDTRGYAQRGLLLERRVESGAGELFGREVYTYELRDATTGQALTSDEARAAASVFPALIREDEYHHEGDPGASLHTYTTQDYDLYGNVTAYYDAGGPGADDDYRAEIHYTAEDPGCRSRYLVGLARSIAVRDAGGQLLSRREATYDCAGGTGQLRQVRTHLGGGQVAYTDLAYHPDGNLAQVTAPANHSGERYALSYTYDPDVRTHVTQIQDSFGYVSSADYDLRFGAVTRETDINGNAVLTDYDAFGRPVRVLGPHELARGLDYTLRFAYAPDAAVPFATTAHMDVFRDVNDPIESVTFMDGLGRVLQVKKDATVHRGLGADPASVMTVSGRTHHDPWGRVVATWYPTEEAKGQNHSLTRAPDPSAPPTRVAYDVLDRARETRLPDGRRTAHAYALAPALTGSGLWTRTTGTDPKGNQRDVYSDGRGSVRAVVDHLDGRPITTRYSYDPVGQLVQVTDAAGNRTATAYDLGGRRTHVVHPDSGLTELVYDPAGNLIRRVTPNLRADGSAIEYRYHFTHLVGVHYPGYSDNDVTYTWGDASLRQSGDHSVGRIIRVDDGSGSLEKTYDALGQVVTETRTIDTHPASAGPEVYTTRYQYDTWGRLQQMVYPDGEVLTYSYDAGGQVRAASGVKQGLVFPYLTRLEYDRFGQRVFQETGNGVRTHFDYDPANRRLVALDAGAFQRVRYDYDAAGNILSLVNDVGSVRPNQYGGRVEQRFEYDDLYRLTGSTGTWFTPKGKENHYTYALSYDDIHNVLRKEQRHWVRGRNSPDIVQHKTTYDWAYAYGSERPHAPTHVGDRSFAYDANGNQLGWDDDLSGQRRTIVWDEENRMRSIADNGRTTDFVYDHAGNRVIKRGAQGETVYVSPGWTVRNGSLGTKHVFVGQTRLASKLATGMTDVQGDTGAQAATNSDDLLAQMLGRWQAHRPDSGGDHARSTAKNPHYQGPSAMPSDGLADTKFVYFYHPDHVGNTSYVTDGEGELYEHVQYFPSGELWADERTNTERLPHLFSSKELDQETGLYNFGARLYDPRVGTWISADPASTEYLDGAGLGGVYNALNLAAYTYAGHNPLKYVDPDGRTLEFAAGSSDQFKADVQTIIDHLKVNSPTAKEVIERLENTMCAKFTIKESPKEARFISSGEERSGTIWIPLRKGLRITGNRIQSPAMVFAHEAKHADHNLFSPWKRIARINESTGDDYDNKEEKLVITEFETKVARDLNEPTRNNHRGKLVTVTGPLSRTQTTKQQLKNLRKTIL